MKKSLLNLFSFLLLTCIVSAQQAEDFTATDINGVEHNLFEYLDDGKTVILDVSATWCGPCWNLHQSHKLDYLNQAFGPEGSDEVVVIFYEGDVNTGSDELNGISGNTLGDWVTGVSYIIIDPETIPAGFLDLYAPQGFPTVSVICPETKEIVADIYNSTYAEMLTEITKCTDLGEVTEATVAGISGSNKACDNITLAAEIINLGSVDLENGVVKAYQDGNEIYSTEITEPIAPGSPFVAEFGEISLMQAETEITYELQLTDLNSSNNEYIANYLLAPETNNLINVYIEADQYVSEDPTTWKIVDDMGNIVIDGPALSPNVTYEGSFTLEELNCYSFIMEDGYGDGNSGVINITDSQGNVIHETSNFGSLADSPFNVSSISVDTKEEELARVISVYPTIVQHEVIIKAQKALDSEAQINIHNTVGQSVFTSNQKLQTNSAIKINTTEFIAGTYILSITINKKVYNTRFVKM